MSVLVRALCLAGIAAAAPAQTVSSPATLQAAPRLNTVQPRATLPPGAAARDAKLRAQMPQDRLQWADRTAARNLSPDALRAEVVNTWPNLATADIEALMFVVMAAAARDVDADLRAQVTAMRDTNAEKQAQRDAAADAGAAQSLRLQMAMDRRAKLMEALSNLMKKADDTQDAIVQNVK